MTATRLAFWINGLILGGYGAALPSIRERLAVEPVTVTALLLSTGFAALVAIQLSGRLSDTVGARRITLAGFSLLVSAVVTFAFASSLPAAIVGALLLGGGNGLMDVAMNVLAVRLEAVRRTPLIGSMHAFWSVGGLMGAGLLLVTAQGLHLRGPAVVGPFMGLLALIGTAAWALAWLMLPSLPKATPSRRPRSARAPGRAWLLGLMALGMGMAEGTATDWSALHVTQAAGVDSTTGAAGLVAVTASMVLIRVLGDPLSARFGRRAVVRAGAVAATAGYVGTVVATDLVGLVSAWALVGLGVGILAPQIYAVAGHAGGARTLSVVVSFGYVAFLIGPAILGLVISRVGLSNAMLVPAVVCACTLAAAGVVPGRRGASAPTP